ncbi:MAG: cyclase family protein [Candidatus Altiarchaeia archaeon]
MKIIDISMPISRGMTVYPGDPKVDIRKEKTLRTDGVVVSKITMGLHTGTHIDAPLHYLPGGKTIEEIPLESLTGDALVCDLSYAVDCIGAKDLRKFPIKKGDIVFLKTKNSGVTAKRFSGEYVHLDADGADYLVKKRIKAVGIDCLSIERSDSTDAAVHKKLLRKDIPIIEGLVLGHVAEGRYLTHCAPLKIKGAEAGPARCVLVQK